MGFYTTTSVTEKPHPETPSCAQKTASGKFFTYPIKTQYENRHNSLKTNQEKPLPTHETASGVFYYKFRHYSAELGRWLGRDPIEEKGGVNLYGFVGNDVLNRWDELGQSYEDIFDNGEHKAKNGKCWVKFKKLIQGDKDVQQMINKIFNLKSRKCKKIKIKCLCCDKEGAYKDATNSPNAYAKKNNIVLCSNSKPNKGTLMHELVHVYDYCLGNTGPFKGLNNCEYAICTELRAHYNQKCQNKRGRKAKLDCAVRNAMLSINYMIKNGKGFCGMTSASAKARALVLAETCVEKLH